MIRVGSGEKETAIMECGTINVEDDEPDESEVRVENVTISKYGATGGRADFDVVNEVVSGDGQSLTLTAMLEINGEAEDWVRVTADPGEVVGHTFEIEGLEPGSNEVCVYKQ